MKNISVYILAILMLTLLSCNTAEKKDGPVKVELHTNDKGQSRLFVNGKEFYVNGAGLEFGNVEALAEFGGNSFRTWRTRNEGEDALEVLDRAQASGLLVLMGLEVERERHGFNYDDSLAVREQFLYLQGEVERLKDHPALLGWAIGNELNLEATNLKVYKAVNEISEMIHRVDPNHPTTSTLAGIGKTEVDYIKEHCRDIDFISIQMYGDIVNLQERIDDAGWDGPYMVTEWGATGHWEVARTEWDVAIENTSAEKAVDFIDRYKKAIRADPLNCLGSYVFLWGQKQERTPTWYGMFLENGNITETVDAVHYAWTGQWPENRCPALESFHLDGRSAYDNIRLKAGGRYNAVVSAKEYENEALVYRWEILPESTDLGLGGDLENRPDTHLSIKTDKSELEIDILHAPGAYRLFVYVSDPGNRSATANIPFYIEE